MEGRGGAKWEDGEEEFALYMYVPQPWTEIDVYSWAVR